MKSSVASNCLLLAISISSTLVRAASVQQRTNAHGLARGLGSKFEARSSEKFDDIADETKRSFRNLEPRFSWSGEHAITPGQVVSPNQAKTGSKPADKQGSGSHDDAEDDESQKGEQQPQPRAHVGTTSVADLQPRTQAFRGVAKRNGERPAAGTLEVDFGRRDKFLDKRFSMVQHEHNLDLWAKAHSSGNPVSGALRGRSLDDRAPEMRERFSMTEHQKNVAKWKAAHGENSSPISGRDIPSDAGFFASLRKRFDFWVHMENVKKWNDEHGGTPVINPIGHRDLSPDPRPLKKRFDFWMHMKNVKKWEDEHGSPVINPIGHRRDVSAEPSNKRRFDFWTHMENIKKSDEGVGAPTINPIGSRDASRSRLHRPPPPIALLGPRAIPLTERRENGFASIFKRFDFFWKFKRPGHASPIRDRGVDDAHIEVDKAAFA